MEAEELKGAGSFLEPSAERDIEQELEQGDVKEDAGNSSPRKYVSDERYDNGFPDYVCDTVKSVDEVSETGYNGVWNIPG